MDPNATLALMRAAIKDGDFAEAGEHAENLDRWISMGGFLPDAWKGAR